MIHPQINKAAEMILISLQVTITAVEIIIIKLKIIQIKLQTQAFKLILFIQTLLIQGKKVTQFYIMRSMGNSLWGNSLSIDFYSKQHKHY